MIKLWPSHAQYRHAARSRNPVLTASGRHPKSSLAGERDRQRAAECILTALIGRTFRDRRHPRPAQRTSAADPTQSPCCTADKPYCRERDFPGPRATPLTSFARSLPSALLHLACATLVGNSRQQTALPSNGALTFLGAQRVGQREVARLLELRHNQL
jgi:hypothetical protein